MFLRSRRGVSLAAPEFRFGLNYLRQVATERRVMAPISQQLTDLAVEIADANKEKGFWEEANNPLIVPTKLALITDEVCEALQEHRARWGDGPENNSGMTDDQEKAFNEELADIIIRTLDLAGHYGFDIGGAIIDKLDKNTGRPPKHGKRY